MAEFEAYRKTANQAKRLNRMVLETLELASDQDELELLKDLFKELEWMSHRITSFLCYITPLIRRVVENGFLAKKKERSRSVSRLLEC